MEPDRRSAMQFTLNGNRVELTREDVEKGLADVAPEIIRKHAVKVAGTWFPVMQALEAATGIPRSDFISHTARRHLAALGYEVAGQVQPQASEPAASGAHAPSVGVRPRRKAGDWYIEANVQAALVTTLAGQGWRILSVANTATKEKGVDVIASRDSQTVGVEVKGFPSRGYADPARAGEVKRTSPSTQAGYWFAQALLAAMRLRGKQPHWRSVIALPDVARYRDLHAETAGSLAAAQIEVWWVDRAGALDPRP